MNQINEQQSAQQKDAVLQASLDFISTLTGMTPPPIEVAPPEVFAPFKAFADRVCAIFSQPLAPISGLSCACVFQGDECVEQCKLHAAWEETLHDQAEELKHLRAAVAKAGGAAPSPAWCASVDAELADTADADAQPVVPELLTDAVVRRGWQHTFSTENPFCPCDLKSFTKAVRWAEMKMLTDLKTQHASDSKELRRLCQERDDLRRANSLHKVNTAALESSVGHLSTLVDELRRLLGAAMQTMTELHGSAAPDESTADIDARIPGAAFAKFVNDHAQLLFEIKNGCAAAPTPTLPAAAVAEGAQLDGDSLEQGE